MAKRLTLTLSDADYSAFANFAELNRLSVASTVLMFASHGFESHQIISPNNAPSRIIPRDNAPNNAPKSPPQPPAPRKYVSFEDQIANLDHLLVGKTE